MHGNSSGPIGSNSIFIALRYVNRPLGKSAHHGIAIPGMDQGSAAEAAAGRSDRHRPEQFRTGSVEDLPRRLSAVPAG
jgi:hypothetical protein